MNVLVIDASRRHIPALRKMSERANVHVVRAIRMEAGLQCLDEERFDVVMMDLVLPGMFRVKPGIAQDNGLAVGYFPGG